MDRPSAQRSGCGWVAMCLGAAALALGVWRIDALAAEEPVAAHSERGNVVVRYEDPTRLTEIQRYPNERTDWLDDLSRFVARRASGVPGADQKLTITITDIQLAGQLEPWRSGKLRDARIVRDTTPPRIALRFRLESAGEVLKQGERNLRDVNFLSNLPASQRGEPLSYEKKLISDWLRHEFPAPAS